MDDLHSNEDFDLRDRDVLESLWAMEDKHFWGYSRNRFILKALRKLPLAANAKILDVGCGSGLVSGYLAQQGYAVTGVDTAPPLILKAKSRYPEVTFFNSKVDDLPETFTGFFDALCFFDVIEHVEEPEKLLRAALRFGKPGCHIVVTVPCWQDLYTDIDAVSGHKKRYEPNELTALFCTVGLEPVAEQSIFKIIYPLLKMRRGRLPRRTGKFTAQERTKLLVDNNRPPAKAINKILGWVCAAEAKYGFPSREGASLLGIGRKQG